MSRDRVPGDGPKCWCGALHQPDDLNGERKPAPLPTSQELARSIGKLANAIALCGGYRGGEPVLQAAVDRFAKALISGITAPLVPAPLAQRVPEKATGIDSAEKFDTTTQNLTNYLTRVSLIETRDAAMRSAGHNAGALEAIDAIAASMAGYFRRNPESAWSKVIPTTIVELRAKYAAASEEMEGPRASLYAGGAEDIARGLHEGTCEVDATVSFWDHEALTEEPSKLE